MFLNVHAEKWQTCSADTYFEKIPTKGDDQVFIYTIPRRHPLPLCFRLPTVSGSKKPKMPTLNLAPLEKIAASSKLEEEEEEYLKKASCAPRGELDLLNLEHLIDVNDVGRKKTTGSKSLSGPPTSSVFSSSSKMMMIPVKTSSSSGKKMSTVSLPGGSAPK